MQDKKKLIWIIVATLLMVLTFKTVLSMSESLSMADLAEALRRSNHIYLTLAVLSMCAYIAFKGEGIWLLLKTFGYPRSQLESMLFSASDTYFSAVTPSASGGQPAALFFMKSTGVPFAAATVTLMVNLISIAISSLVTGLAALLMHFELIPWLDLLPKIMIALGFAILSGLICLIILLLLKGEIIYGVGMKLIDLLARIHIMKKPDKYRTKLRRIIDQYKECVRMTRGRARTMFVVWLMGFGHKVCQITTTMLIHLALGGDNALAGHVWASTALSQVGSGCMPMPGGMGVVDYLLLQFFGQLFPLDQAIELELISRSVACYLCIILSGLVTLIGYLVFRFRLKRGE